MSQRSQRPYPVLGDSLPEPIQAQLNSLLREAPMGRDKQWSRNSKPPLYLSDRETLDRLRRKEEAQYPQIWVPSDRPNGQANRR